jgi:hypothetical protein
MPRKKSDKTTQHQNRIKGLLVVCGLCAVVLVTTTYAWFTGLQAINVTPFEVEIAVADGLQLSLDGKKWGDTVTFVDAQDLQDQGATFNWPQYIKPGTGEARNGLVPLSTQGEIDKDASQMVFYEKSSLTTSDGGYRILANKIDHGKQKGYLFFDLFIKNFSGTQYISSDDPDDNSSEEAIYLDFLSEVKIGSTGIEDSGIENSIRVAFAQLARITADTGIEDDDVAKLKAMDCKGTAEGATGICRAAQIWEPNDTKHVLNAMKYYENSCKLRNEDGSYTKTACPSISGQAPTYSIAKAFGKEKTDVDIYDGEAYNGYTKNSEYLKEIETITDTEKNYIGVLRPTFMTLAPNSITKVRVYVYIEGQDIDNFDYSQIGKQISVGFGFTKQRFTTDDVGITEGELYDELPTSVKPTRVR